MIILTKNFKREIKGVDVPEIQVRVWSDDKNHKLYITFASTDSDGTPTDFIGDMPLNAFKEIGKDANLLAEKYNFGSAIKLHTTNIHHYIRCIDSWIGL